MHNNTDTLARLRAGHLAGATRLDLRHCGLHELPPQVLDLAETLEHLDLSGNALQALPDSFARLQRLRVLFCADNPFTTLPAVLGRCAALDTIGFKANHIHTVPPDALPTGLRWLILTDNRITSLPETLGDCPRLQKLMLAGNRLTALPLSLGRNQRLELLRLAANRFETAAAALPPGLLALPRLAWLAFAGNPFNQAQELPAQAIQAAQNIETSTATSTTPNPARQSAADIAWPTLQLQGLLGEGASGVIHAALWQPASGPALPVALKLFKGAITSDGLPASEMAACIAAGAHPHLVGVLGRLVGHPSGMQGLVLRRIPAGHRNLAGPPSLATCTRDVYPAGWRPSAAAALAIMQGMGAALAHLHQRGLVHGDVYAHNILVDAAGQSLLGDFGAASFLPGNDPVRCAALQRIDQRALAVLGDELADRPAHALASTGAEGAVRSPAPG